MTYNAIITPVIPNKEYVVPYTSTRSATDYKYVGINVNDHFKHTLSGFCKHFPPVDDNLVVTEEQMDTIASFLVIAKDKQTFMNLACEYLGTPITAFDC